MMQNMKKIHTDSERVASLDKANAALAKRSCTRPARAHATCPARRQLGAVYEEQPRALQTQKRQPKANRLVGRNFISAQPETDIGSCTAESKGMTALMELRCERNARPAATPGEALPYKVVTARLECRPAAPARRRHPGLVILLAVILFLGGPASVQGAAVPENPVGNTDTVAVATTDTTSVLTTEIPPAALSEIPLDTIWARANAAYSNRSYRQAVDLYETLLAQGMHSGKLYYNLGNSWFKQGRMGKAILNYNRALLLDPTDEDTQYNLAMANARIVDKIDTVPEFFLKSWLRDLGLLLSADLWAILGLIFLGLTFGATILWLLSNTLPLRKLGFYGGVSSLILCIVCTYYADFQRGRLLHSNEAVVMNLVAPVKSSPGAGSKDIFVLHEGTKVRMQEQLDGWTEILLSDGNKGWIATNAIESIVTHPKAGE